MIFHDKHLELDCTVVNKFTDNNTDMIVYKFYDVNKWIYKCISVNDFNLKFEMNIFQKKS
ncbi:hypothetical protein TAESTU_30801 [Tenacibaculum aestuarii]